MGKVSISQRWAPTSEAGGTPNYYLTNFSRKLHENEETLAQGRERTSLAPPPGSATGVSTLDTQDEFLNYTRNLSGRRHADHGTHPH